MDTPDTITTTDEGEQNRLQYTVPFFLQIQTSSSGDNANPNKNKKISVEEALKRNDASIEKYKRAIERLVRSRNALVLAEGGNNIWKSLNACVGLAKSGDAQGLVDKILVVQSTTQAFVQSAAQIAAGREAPRPEIEPPTEREPPTAETQQDDEGEQEPQQDDDEEELPEREARNRHAPSRFGEFDFDFEDDEVRLSHKRKRSSKDASTRPEKRDRRSNWPPGFLDDLRQFLISRAGAVLADKTETLTGCCREFGLSCGIDAPERSIRRFAIKKGLDLRDPKDHEMSETLGSMSLLQEQRKSAHNNG